MIDRTAWQEAFLGSHAPTAAKALKHAWDLLVATSPDTFNAREIEPTLTKILCEQLIATKREDRLTGLWSYENPQGKLVRKGKRIGLENNRRTDIRYFTDRADPALELIFEFKRLNHQPSQRKKYTGESGMMRFITGDYSVGNPLALMVGILNVHRDDCVPPLTQWLNSAEAKAELHMETVDRKQTRNPSGFFVEAEFDTEHLRPIGKGPAHGTIVISHLFLDFPNLPRAVTKKSRRAGILVGLGA